MNQITAQYNPALYGPLACVPYQGMFPALTQNPQGGGAQALQNAAIPLESTAGQGVGCSGALQIMQQMFETVVATFDKIMRHLITRLTRTASISETAAGSPAAAAVATNGTATTAGASWGSLIDKGKEIVDAVSDIFSFGSSLFGGGSGAPGLWNTATSFLKKIF